jgi:hypothetical protein
MSLPVPFILASASAVASCSAAPPQESLSSKAQEITPVTMGGMTLFPCSTEGTPCVIGAGPAKHVAFGSGSSFTFLDKSGTVNCDAATFGAPAGSGRTCYTWPYALLGPEFSSQNVAGNIAFGANGSFLYKQMSGAFTCDRATFGGDPTPGVFKACYQAVPEFSQAVTEGSNMQVNGPTPVAFGANGGFTFKVLNGSIPCNLATFGTDPQPGVLKTCYTFGQPLLVDEGTEWSLSGPLLASRAGKVFFGSGLNDRFMSTNMMAGGCDNTFFTGDPDFGTFKHCWASSVKLNEGPDVLSRPNVTVVFWGQGWNDASLNVTRNRLVQTASAVLTGPYFNALAEYGIGKGFASGPGQIINSTVGTLDSSTSPPAASELVAAFDAIAAGGANNPYPLLPLPTPGSNTIYLFFSAPDNNGSGCSYHSKGTWRGTTFRYICKDSINVNDLTNNNTPWLIGHEIVEAASNPDVSGGIGTSNGGEIGDTCEMYHGTTDGRDELGNVVDHIPIETYFSNANAACVIPSESATWMARSAPPELAPAPGGITGAVTAVQPNGRWHVFARGSDGILAAKFMRSDATWSRWYPMNQAIVGRNATAVKNLGTSSVASVVASRSDGHIVYTEAAGVGSLVSQTSLNLVFGGRSCFLGCFDDLGLGGLPPGVTFTDTFTILMEANGFPTIFALGTDQALYFNSQNANGWAGWTTLQGSVQGGVIAAALDVIGRVQVFVKGTDGTVSTRRETSANSHAFDPWQPIGSLAVVGCSTCAGSSADLLQVGYNQNEQLEVFTRGSDGSLWHIKVDDGSHAGWATWQSLGVSGIIDDTLSVAISQFNYLDVYVRGLDRHLYHKTQTRVNGGNADWTDYQPLQGDISDFMTAVADTNGLVNVFSRSDDTTLFQIQQITRPHSSTPVWR